MNRRHMGVSLITGLAAFAVLAAAQAQEGPYTLKHGQKAGDAWQAVFEIVADVNGTQVPIKRTTVTKVKEVKANGETVVVITDKGGSVTLNGEEQTMTPEPPVTVTLDGSGKLLKYEESETSQGPIGPETKQMVALMGNCIFPKTAVKKGDAWTTETPSPYVKDAKLAIKSTFEGTTKVENVDLLKVKQAVDVKTEPNAEKTVIEMCFLLDPTTFAVSRIEGSVKGLVTQYGVMDWAVKVVMKKVTEPSS